MKRPLDADDSSRPRKLVSLFRHYELPNVDTCKTLDVNFNIYGSINEPDISICNGDGPDVVRFDAHKAVLSAISPFFKTMFVGDSSIKEFKMEELSNEMMGFLQEFIYVDTVRDVTRERCAASFLNMEGSIILISKYLKTISRN